LVRSPCIIKTLGEKQILTSVIHTGAFKEISKSNSKKCKIIMAINMSNAIIIMSK